MNAILCEPFNGTPTGGAPVIPACATTPFATLAAPCTFSSTPTKPGGSTYPIVPGTCHPGTLGRDAIPGPDFLNTDFSVTKDTKITERLNLQFRTEMFEYLQPSELREPGADRHQRIVRENHIDTIPDRRPRVLAAGAVRTAAPILGRKLNQPSEGRLCACPRFLLGG
jgi:hypothetical protein